MPETRVVPAELLDCDACGGPFSANDTRHGYRVCDACVDGVDDLGADDDDPE